MDITALPVHFVKFMCTSFPACGRTKLRADEKDTEIRARERGKGAEKNRTLYDMPYMKIHLSFKWLGYNMRKIHFEHRK